MKLIIYESSICYSFYLPISKYLIILVGGKRKIFQKYFQKVLDKIALIWYTIHENKKGVKNESKKL